MTGTSLGPQSTKATPAARASAPAGAAAPDQAPAVDLSACIPTSGRNQDLVQTIESLLAGRLAPATVVVSPSDAAAPRGLLGAALRPFAARAGLRLVLLDPPPCGSRSGNRNWLAEHVETPFLVFADDDVDLNPAFVEQGMGQLRSGAADVVVATSEEVGGATWLTPRGHFRRARPGEPIAVGFQGSIWRTSVFRDFWLDEHIRYGYEDAELSLRLHASGRVRIEQSPHLLRDRGIGRTVGLDRPQAAREAESSRCYVAIKRYSTSRARLAGFLLAEAGRSATRGRLFPPAETVPRQWRQVVRFLAGGAPPDWAHPGIPTVSHLQSRP